MKPAKQIAFCGITAAISLLFFLATGIFPFASYAIPAFCGLFLVPIIIELGRRQAFLIFLAVSFLSLLLSPDKQASFAYIFLLGYYPIAKVGLEKIRPRVLEWFCKMLICLGAILAIFLLSSFLVGWEAAFAVPIPLYIAGVFGVLFSFLVYDWCISKISFWYLEQLRPRYFRRFFS